MLKEGELAADSVIKESLITAADGSHEQMKTIAEQRYAQFDESRRNAEALEADREDIKSLEDAEKKLTKKPPNG